MKKVSSRTLFKNFERIIKTLAGMIGKRLFLLSFLEGARGNPFFQKGFPRISFQYPSYPLVLPPATLSVTPSIYPALSLAMKATVVATSESLPERPIGVVLVFL